MRNPGSVSETRRHHRAQVEPAGWIVRIRRVPTASILVTLVGTLCVIGLVMVGSASSVISLDLYGSPWAILIRQLLWMGVGIVALVFACRFDYRRWKTLGVPLLVVTVLLLFAVLLPGIGVTAGGSSRWIGFGQLRVQPSELMKLAMAIFGAGLVVRRVERGGSYRTVAGPLLLVAAAAALLILMQPDMGTALVIACISLALLFSCGVPMGPVVKATAALAALGAIVAVADPYRRARVLSFLDPSAHASGSGYQVVQSLIGLGSGHLFGLGLGSGREKWGLLPNGHTDFIYSVIGEELGLVGALTVLVLLGALAWFGLRAASRAPDQFGTLLAVAIVAWITAETVVNVGAVVGLLPVTGIPLPFISFGGSSLVITLVGAGILVNIAKHEPRERGGPSLQLVADPGSTRRSDRGSPRRAPRRAAEQRRHAIDDPKRTTTTGGPKATA
jgi:cell division protein FtsW